MKNLVMVLVLLLCAAFVAAPVAQAQNAYNQGDKVVSLGIGYGLGGLYGTAGMPPISLGFDYGFEKKISLGGLVAYSSSTDDFGTGFSWKYTYIVIGARGAYHFLEDNKNIDAYAGLILGYNIVSASWNGTSAQPGFGFSSSASYMLFGGFVGARYYFSPKFGAFAELGYGAGIITAGISYKL